MEQHLTDDDSSESITSYMDDLNIRRKNDKRDSAGRSIRSSKSSPQRSFDDDSEAFSRRSYRQSARDRRANSLARSASSRSERRPSRVRSDSTQDSETEIGTRALVQAKIREKVAQAESMDESSSDLFKPTPIGTAKIEKSLATAGKKQTATTAKNKEAVKEGSKERTPVSNKAVDITKTVPKQEDRRKSIERVIKPKITSDGQTTTKIGSKTISKPTTTKITKTTKSIETKMEVAKQLQPVASEKEAATATKKEVSETDLASVPDSSPEGPPKTPDYEWTCEYCTFENEANVKICGVCCKTPSAAAIPKANKLESENQSPRNSKVNESADLSKEGRGKRISRKISFWPGTKPK